MRPLHEDIMMWSVWHGRDTSYTGLLWFVTEIVEMGLDR